MIKKLTLLFFTIFMGFTVSCKSSQCDYKVLYSNDTTHILTCQSPYHDKGEHFTEDMLRESIDETAGTGIDVHLLQPGTMWTPWWQSKIYPMSEHYKWFESRYGFKPSADFNDYVFNGGDMISVFVEQCRKNGLAPFLSFRMNDGHFLETWDDEKPSTSGYHCLSKFYVEHAPEYCIGDKFEGGLDAWDSRVQNWAIDEVRQYKLSFIKEICDNYDLDGLELDFMRHASYFKLDETTSLQRKNIMQDVIKTVRGYLDKNSNGRHKYLCVRIPAFIGDHDRLGIDVGLWAQAGVDMFNLSSHYFTSQQTDLADIVKEVGGKAVYLEMTQTIRTGKILVSGSKYSDFTYRRTTDNQFYTAAHLAYSRGATGVSTFNFQYYRANGSPKTGPFCEPPFHVFEKISDKQWVARQPQHYVLAGLWNGANRCCPQIPKNGKVFTAGDSAVFKMDMTPTLNGWKKDGKLRIQSESSLDDTAWTVKVNGVELVSAEDVSEPYTIRYPHLLGSAINHRGWIVDKNILVDGINKIELKQVSGKDSNICFIDIAIE